MSRNPPLLLTPARIEKRQGPLPAASVTRPEHIYKYIRNLRGVVGYVEEAPASEDEGSAERLLGYWAGTYLSSHGYTANSVGHIQHAFEQSNSVDEFSSYLCDMGMPTAEANWLWSLIVTGLQ
jgi:hypothetical protein